MPNYTLYYADGSYRHAASRRQWRAAPDRGLQVWVRWPPPRPTIHERPWAGVSDRFLDTGRDTYDPEGWGVKYGSLIPDADYERIWHRAFSLPRPT